MKRYRDLIRLHRYIRTVTTGVVVFGIVAFCIFPALSQKQVQQSSYAALMHVPEKARAKRNPLEGDTQAIAAGGKLFEQHCAECHGQKAGGTKHGVSLLREEVQQATPGTLFWLLTNGVVRRGMPVWSKLPEPERWQLVGFVRSLKARPMSTNSDDSQRSNSSLR